MALWKLQRHIHGTEEYNLNKGDQVTVGRNTDNIISLSSIVISRNHCVIKVEDDKVLITDLKSSNGVFVNNKKIPPNVPHAVKDSDFIGFGWAAGARLVDIKNKEKFVFKLTKQKTRRSVIERIQFQTENDDIEKQIEELNKEELSLHRLSPIIVPKPQLKRKSEENNHVTKLDNVVDLISDSDNEIQNKEAVAKKIKLETINEDPVKHIVKDENKYIESHIFNVKKEYVGYDEDEAIQIDSDSDSESEQWLMRLSQSSPGKPFVKVNRESNADIKPEESSYSQIDDDLLIEDFLHVEEDNEEDEEYLEDIITIPAEPRSDPITFDQITETRETVTHEEKQSNVTHANSKKSSPASIEDEGIDIIDGGSGDNDPKINANCLSNEYIETLINKNIKQALLIEPQVLKRKSLLPVEKKSSPVQKPPRQSKEKRQSTSKRQITNSQKEERKKKLKEIASKDKDSSNLDSSNASGSNKVVAAKVSSSNRGAFLTDTVEVPSKTTKKKESHGKKAKQDKKIKPVSNDDKAVKEDEPEKSKVASPQKPTPEISSLKRIPLKKLKPLTGNDDMFSGKPCSMVQPLPAVKPKKKVRFSENLPEVRTFEIEPGNKMKKTSLVKTTLVDSLRQGPVYSMDKLTLMKILRWNPHWFEEQMNNNEPPPILGHNNPPMTIFHYFKSHHQYVQLVGDLLLMEIWECLSQAYTKVRNQNVEVPMRIASLPPFPTQERCFDLFNISVNVSMPTSEVKCMFRVGDILLVSFGQEAVKNLRLFFVHNIRTLPQHNKNSFFSVTIQAMFTDKMRFLKYGELMVAKSLDHINKELMLFEAMEFLAKSPLGEAIMRPLPEHFPIEHNMNTLPDLCWTQKLNESQQTAVSALVNAALSDRPSIHMIQGPPGTGKSSVICATVMSYFYDSSSKRLPNRSKILLCATSNTAVDELVLRLLHIRQSLPKEERFRMVRVGRADAMNARARDVSSQHLAHRDAARHKANPSCPGLDAEISHLEAKINMWKTAASDAKNPEREAYCQGKVHNLINRIGLLRNNGGLDVRPEHIMHAEKRIIEGADIVATTLASAQNHKMKVIKGSIALCIVDEAGQALEPETLAPLTLQVNHLALVGDPQQLPGYICSQRAKKHGLGESLFARLTSVAEQWPSGNAVVLLNEQYRMHRHIADYPNRAFYAGRIQTKYQASFDLPIPPYSIVAIASGDKGQVGGANELESWGVARLVVAIQAAVRSLNLNLAVITPYNAQKELIKRNLRMLQDRDDNCHVEVNTVDSFQGQERDIVVVSLARSHGAGFLTDCGRMNVLLTRAKHALLLCLNPAALLGNHQWRTLVEDAQKRKLYTTLPNRLCQYPGRDDHASPEEVLKYIAKKDRRHGKS